MAPIQVFVVGKTLFTDAILNLLDGCEETVSLTCFPTLEESMQAVKASSPDVLVLVDYEVDGTDTFTDLVKNWPEIPVIWAELKNDYLRLVKTKDVSARSEDLFHAITTLAEGR